jgi:phosphatidate cytidylyltransferase
MLQQRVITAVILLAVLLPALFWPTPLPLMLLTLILIAAAGWEWGRLNGLAAAASLGLGVATLALCAGAWSLGWTISAPHALWLAAALAWVLGGGWLLMAGVEGWPRIPRALRLAGGLLALGLAWLAMAQAKTIGVNFLLSVLVLVWVADIFAYFAGRAFGLKFTRRKLAPAISPGKSWEGVWGGMAGVAVLAFAWTAADRVLQPAVPSFYSQLGALGWPVLLLGVLFLAAMSVVGDLTESLVKRSAGAKDSSQLLPGHGGVLDRVDALLPTLPLAMMLAGFVLR